MLKLLALPILISLSGTASSTEATGGCGLIPECDGASSATETASDYPRYPDWMRDSDNSLLITELSIPGTHDSGADYCHCEQNYGKCYPLSDFVVAQTYDIEQQLEMGIRFFDVRLAYENNDLRVHHGPIYLEQNFSDLCNSARNFLSENPSEFVIFLIKQEHSSVAADTFWQRMDAQINACDNNLFIRDKKIPTVGNARGKIILMARNYSSKVDQGFHVNWSNNTPHDEGSDGELRYVVEDLYSPGSGVDDNVDTKQAVIFQNLSLPRICDSCIDPNMLLLTFLSAEHDKALIGPADYAQQINPLAAFWLQGGYTPPKAGVVLMDFAGDPTCGGDKLITGVIAKNRNARAIPGNLPDNTSGGGITAAYINGNDIPDLIFFYIDDQPGHTPDRAYYRIGFDLGENDGYPSTWSRPMSIPWQGELHQGGGIAVADVNGNLKPDLVVFAIDAPAGSDNHGWYRIGWDMNIDGEVPSSNWSAIVGPGGWFGTESQGGGVSIAELNGNKTPELVVFGIDHSNPNRGYYRVYYDLNKGGVPSTRNTFHWIPWQGQEQQGGGIAVKDMNKDGRPDLLAFMVDNPSGDNHVWYRYGWNMNSSGTPATWEPFEEFPGWVGGESQGGGVAITDLNGNINPEFVFFWIDNPNGPNKAYYRILWDAEF